MKRLISCCMMLFFSISCYCQTATIFDGNQIKAPIQMMNGLFVDTTAYYPRYEFPAGSGSSTIWLTNLWVYGKDSVTNEVKGFGDRYYNNGQDTWPGPLVTNGSATVSSLVSANFNKIWKVTRAEVDSFIVNYSNGNVTSFVWPVPVDMINWPVNAAVGYQQPHSPFYDSNSDGIYNVYDGDYPIIQGDQMLRWIFNDNFDIHTEGMAHSMGAEVQCNFYGCSSSNLSAPLNRTTFLEYTIINRSDSSYKEVYLGLNVEADIGSATDDYIRSNVTANTMQFYNAAGSYDYGSWSSPGYGNAPPVQSITLLEISNQSTQPLMSGMVYYNNSGSVTGDPVDYLDQYSYLRGYWRDSSNIVYGCNGYSSGPCVSSPICKYMFPGDSDPTFIGTNGIATAFNWSEENTGGIPNPNPAGDRRGLISAGPFNFPAGQSFKFTIAFITSQDSTITIDSLLKKNILEVNEITQGYLSNSLPCQVGASIGLQEISMQELVSIFPNPASNFVQIKSNVSISKIEILNLNGSFIKTIYNSNQFTVEDLADGIYFVRISFDNGETMKVKKLVVTR